MTSLLSHAAIVAREKGVYVGLSHYGSHHVLVLLTALLGAGSAGVALTYARDGVASPALPGLDADSVRVLQRSGLRVPVEPASERVGRGGDGHGNAEERFQLNLA